MKAKTSMNEESLWVKQASKLLKRINEANVQIDAVFPLKEYLQPLEHISGDKKAKAIDFLSWDISQLVPVAELEKALAEAVQYRVPEGQILHSELRIINSKITELKSTILQFAALGYRSYAEAKSLFADLLKTGIWIEEAAIVRKIIQVNKKIETYLSDNDHNCLAGLREISETDGKYIDASFKKIIASRFQEISLIQKRLERVFTKSVLEFDDFQAIEKLVKECKQFPFFIPNHEQLFSLYKSFIWVYELGVKFDLKSANLAQWVSQLIMRIRIAKENGELKDKREKISEASKFTYVQAPINKLVHEVKLMLWDTDVRSYLARPLFKREELKALLEKAPTLFYGQNGPPPEYGTIKTLVERARMWEADVERIIRQTNELRTCENEVFNKRMSSSVGQIEEAITKAKEEYNGSLKQIEEFHLLKHSLDMSEKILVMSKCVYRIASAKKIDHNDYLKAKELFKDPRCKEFMKDNLFMSFRRLLVSFNKEVKLLKEVYLKIASKEAHATPDLFEPKFLGYAKELYKADAALEAITKAENFILLGEFGVIIKNFINDFKKAESSLLVLYNDHPYSLLPTYDAYTLHEIIEEFSARKQKWRIRLYSNYLEELARYEWLLHSLYNIQSDQAQLETLERLLDCSEVAIQDDRAVVQQLQKKITVGRALVEEIQAVLNCSTGLTVEDLKLAKKKLEQSHLVVKGLKKQIESEYKAYEMLEFDFNSAKDAKDSGCICCLDELKVLLKDALALKYKAPTIQNTLKNTISISEALLQCIVCSKPYQEVLEAIQRYQQGGLKVQEVEIILKNRQIALDFLQQDDIPIEKMAYKELKILEKSIINSLDKSYLEKFGNRMLKRKFNLLYHLEKKGQDLGDDNKIKLNDLIEISEEMKQKQQLFSADDLDYIQEKLSQSKMYIEQMKRVKEETLKKCQRVLFNFLDISEEIKQIYKLFHPSVSTLDRLLKPQPEKPAEIKIEQGDSITEVNADILDKSDRKLLRKEYIVKIRNCIQSVMPSMSKSESTELSKGIEQMIFSQSKPTFAEYKRRITDYTRLIEKVHKKTFLMELITSKPLPSEVVTHLLEDNSPEFKGLEDSAQARRYFRSIELMFERNNQGSKASSHQPLDLFKGFEQGGVLGKRELPCPFLDEEINLIQAAQKRTKEWSDQKSSHNYSIYENISLDNSTTEVRKTFDFAAAKADLVDMEEIDDDSCSLTSESAGNETAVKQMQSAANGKQSDYQQGTEVSPSDDEQMDKEGEEHEGIEEMQQEQLVTEGHGAETSAMNDWLSETNQTSEQKQSTSEEKGEEEVDVKSNLNVELVEAIKADNEKGDQMAREELTNTATAQNRKKSLGYESMDIENHNDSSQIDQVKPYEIFRGTLKFTALNKTVPEIKLIALSTSSGINNIPDFNREAVIIEEHLLPKEFEREVERLKTKILKQDMLVVSGFVYTNSNMNKVLGDIRKTRNSIFYTNIREGIRLYLIGPNEVSSSAKFMFEEFSELERISCEFLWLLVFEKKEDLNRKAKLKLFSSAITYRNAPEKSVSAATKSTQKDASKTHSHHRASNGKPQSTAIPVDRVA